MNGIGFTACGLRMPYRISSFQSCNVLYLETSYLQQKPQLMPGDSKNVPLHWEMFQVLLNLTPAGR